MITWRRLSDVNSSLTLKRIRALQPQIQERISCVLEHGQYIMGPEVKDWRRSADYTGAKHCITASGTITADQFDGARD